MNRKFPVGTLLPSVGEGGAKRRMRGHSVSTDYPRSGSALKSSTWLRIAVSTGSRSMELAP